jgi:hypothetical protein
MCRSKRAKENVQFLAGNMLATIKNFLARRQRGLIFALRFKNGWLSIKN